LSGLFLLFWSSLEFVDQASLGMPSFWYFLNDGFPELLGLFFSKIFRRLLFEFDDQAKELFGFLNHYFLKIFGWLLLEFDHQAC